MPYDHKNTIPPSSDQMKLLLEQLNHLHCHKRCMIGSGGGSVGSVVLISKAFYNFPKHNIQSTLNLDST